MAKNFLQTYNFSLRKEDGCGTDLTFYDSRNKIQSSNTDVYDIKFYINYFTTLQMKQAQWTTFSHFDLGMVPMAMGPSQLHNLIVPVMIRVCEHFGVKTYPMRPVSLLPGSTSVDKLENDIWVFRKDIAEATGTTELGFSVIDFLGKKEVRNIWLETFHA